MEKKMKPVKENIITEEVWTTPAGRSYYRSVSALNTLYKIRINIEVGSTEDQSRANIEAWAWATMSWNQIHNIPAALMKSHKACAEYVRDNKRITYMCFAEDAHELVKVASIILGLCPVPSDDEE
jgi:hypothetical protein